MEKGPETPDTSQMHKNKLRLDPGVISVFAVLVMVFVMGLVKIFSADLGFHLKSAERMLNTGHFIYTDSFSYGSDGHHYYDLQWLFQLLVYFLYKMGQPVLVVVNALLISSSVALAWFRFSKYPTAVPGYVKAAVFAVMAFLLVLPLTYEIRPHVLSWIYLNLLLLALESYKRGKHKAVFFLPVIMLFWVNTHSLSILGLVTIGIYNAGIYFEDKKTDKKLLLFSALALAAFLINPYFIDGLLFPLKQFGLISGNGFAKSYVGEFISPFNVSDIQMLGIHYFSNPLFLLHLSAVIVIACLIRSIVQKKITDALLLAAYLFLLYLGYKNYGYYLMVSLPLIARNITDWQERRVMRKDRKYAALLQKEKSRKEVNVTATAFHGKAYQRIAAAIILLTVLISITCINDGYAIFMRYQDRFGFTEDKNQLPVEATAFLVKNNIRGKMLNHFNFGGYLMAHTDAKVFIDGRLELIDDVFFNNYYSSVTDVNSTKKLLDTFNPDIVIFPHGNAIAWWQYFLTYRDTTGYKPVYFDGLSVIYLKSSVFPQIPELTARSVQKDLDVSAVKRLDSLIHAPDKPDGAAVWLQSLWKKQVFPMEDIRKVIFCFNNGFDTAALAYCVKSLEETTVQVPDIYAYLSVYYRQRKMYNEALLCEGKVEENK